jgi:hypothetical protein
MLILLTCCPSVLFAEDIPTSHRASTIDDPFDSIWQDAWTLPDVIIENDKEIIQNDEYLTWLLLAGGGSIALHADGADHDIADDIGEPSLNKDLDKLIDYAGGPGQHFAVAGLWYLFAADRQDTVGKERAWTMLKALSVTGATTLGLKIIRNNDTPNGKNLAWPSGHTSSSFTVAAVLDEFYGPEVGIPAYFAAGFVGYRMMDSGDHWASDVLFGAVLGYITGHHVAGKHKDNPLAGLEIKPLTSNLTDENLAGISLVKRF